MPTQVLELSDPPAGRKRGREINSKLTEESSYDDVLQWLQLVITDTTSYNGVVATWEKHGERPDGQVLLNCTEQELQDGLHLTKFSDRKKVWCALTALKPRVPLGAVELNITPQGLVSERHASELKGAEAPPVGKHISAPLSEDPRLPLGLEQDGNKSGASLSGRRTRRGTLIAPETPVRLPEPEAEVEEVPVTAPVELFDTCRNDIPFQMVFSTTAACTGLKFLLYTMPLYNLIQVLKVFSWLTTDYGVSETRMCQPRKRDPITGERRDPYPVRVGRKQLAENIHAHLHPEMGDEAGARRVLTRLAASTSLLDDMHRYLALNFSSCPPASTAVETVEAILKLWASCSKVLPPEACVLGTRTIYLTPYHTNHANGVRKEGRVGELARYFEQNFVRVKEWQGERKVKTSQLRAELLDWLRNAELLVTGQVSARYKIHDCVLEVTFIMKRHTVGERLSGGAVAPAGEGMDVDAPGGSSQAARQREEAMGGCDMALLLSKLDHIAGSPALAAIRTLTKKIEAKDEELFAQGVSAEPAGDDGCLSHAQFNELLNTLDSATYPLSEELDQQLTASLLLTLKPFQKQAVAFMLREEASSGSGRHLWVELPAAEQPPAAMRYEHEVRQHDSDSSGEENGADEEGAEEEDEMEEDGDDNSLAGDADDECFGDEEMGFNASQGMEVDGADGFDKENATPGASSLASQPQSSRSRGTHDGSDFQLSQGRSRRGTAAAASRRGRSLAARLVAAAEPVGPRPAVRVFFSPLLNMIVWHNHMKGFHNQTKVMGRLALGNTNGGYCCLAVGMGKTATVLALSQQPAPQGWWSAPQWSDKLLFDGHTGHCSNLVPGPTLVIAPMTIMAQWEIECSKFLPGGSSKLLKFYNEKSKRPLTPGELAEKVRDEGIDIIITTTDIAVKDLDLLKGMHWLRIIVDEAHQVPKLLQHVAAIPARSKWLVTGTPVGTGGLRRDLQTMLEVQHLPQYNLLARRPRDMGYLLHGLMVRYTMRGTDAAGNPHMVLPKLSERTVEVPWSDADAAWFGSLHEEIREEAAKIVREAEACQMAYALAQQENRDPEVSLARCRPNHMTIMKRCLEPLQRACAGGMAVTVSNPPEDWEDPEVPEDAEGDSSDLLQRNEFGRDGSWRFSSKISALVDDLTDLKAREPHSKVLIFSKYRETLNALKEALAPEGFQFRTLVGSMPLKKRAEALQAFQSDPPTTVFLLTAQAAAVGLTLTAASHVYLMEPSLNPRQELQAIGRAHRMGQNRPVTVTRLIMEDSVEGRIRELVMQRADRGEIDKFCVDAHELSRFRLKAGRHGPVTKSEIEDPDTAVVAAAARTDELLALLD